MSAFIQGKGDVFGPSSAVDSEAALFDGTSGKIIKRATGTGVVTLASGVQTANATLPIANMPTGSVLQNVAATPITGFVSSAGNVIPFDNTIPQWGEGAVLISLSITPLVATSRIHLVCSGMFCIGTAGVAGNVMEFAFFRGVGPSAIYSTGHTPTNLNFLQTLVIDCFDAPGAGTFTYTVKWGGSAVAYAVLANGSSPGQLFGGSSQVNFYAEEIKA